MIQKRLRLEAIEILEEIFEGMDKGRELKDNKICI